MIVTIHVKWDTRKSDDKIHAIERILMHDRSTMNYTSQKIEKHVSLTYQEEYTHQKIEKLTHDRPTM
jgi:hypothetical protein